VAFIYKFYLNFLSENLLTKQIVWVKFFSLDLASDLQCMPPFVYTSYLRTFNDFPEPMKKVKMKPEGEAKIPYQTDAVAAFES
jgi:hypothetical protein